MIDIGKILKRSWHILWNYKTLWIFAIILVVAGGASFRVSGGGGSSGGGGGSGYTFDGGSGSIPACTNKFCRWFTETFHPLAVMAPETVHTLIVIGIVFLCLLIVTILVMAVARYVSESAIIRMVDEYEQTGTKLGFRQGFRLGWSKSAWRFFLIDLLVFLPTFALILVLLLIGLGVYFAVASGNPLLMVVSIFATIGLVFLLVFVTIIVEAVLVLFREIAVRFCALEQTGPIESLRRAFKLIRHYWQSVGLVWLVMFGLGIAWGLAWFIALIALIFLLPVAIIMVLISIVAGLVVAALPALLAGWITSLFTGGPFPWIVGALAGIPFFVLAASSPWVLIEGWVELFKSNVWTLTYRELKTMQNLEASFLPPAAA